ncbi:hypothetical protein HUA74_33485 [Myxococcus sp. CA051A]|uniref:hypothetical protein n=1 Tax=unclassified Myxococcus TaxID=2648731 RepID=UPI00157B8746|nr:MULTISPECIES: hypothetical protein [unclassified Myxococcus]NTX11983.1 hypothetical protein [Myxococcus sp. CA056]NTX39256.1 hypothetical protein [Myxococcus sp. CA033]NTX57260.1 hypothetical protein [Myxococcus sp. CA039A]NTX65583.1 hypothetical protein [Myxococcus sp. CA051A]
MPKYCREKFENSTTGKEVWVCWQQDKHVHDASLITTIAQWLGTNQGGVWQVRANSYQSNQSSPGENDLSYSS